MQLLGGNFFLLIGLVQAIDFAELIELDLRAGLDTLLGGGCIAHNSKIGHVNVLEAAS